MDALEIDSVGEDLPEKLAQLGAAYDPQKLAEMFAHKRGEISARAVAVTGALSKFLSAIARDWATGQLARNTERRAEELVTMLTRLGPSFVKLGARPHAHPDIGLIGLAAGLTQVKVHTSADEADVSLDASCTLRMQACHWPLILMCVQGRRCRCGQTCCPSHT